MNLKKSVFSAAFVLCFSALFAQAVEEQSGSKFYVKAYAGYGLVNPGSYRLITNASTSNGTAFGTSKSGLGGGIRFGGGIGVIASDFLNIGVDVDYLSASTVHSESREIDNTTSIPSEYISLSRLNYTSIAINPNIVFKAISKEDYLIYTKVGLLLNLPMNLNYSSLDSLVPQGSANNYNQVFNGTYKFGLTVGLNVALGVQYRLTDNLRAFGEVFGHFISFVPQKYDEVSVQTKPTSETRTTHITYLDHGIINYTTNSDNTLVSYNAPQEENRYNMNTIGINIGLTYRF